MGDVDRGKREQSDSRTLDANIRRGDRIKRQAQDLHRMGAKPTPLTTSTVLQLQCSAGNAATADMLNSTSIQRVGAEDPPFGHFPAERKIIEQEAAKKRRAEQRTAAWRATVGGQAVKDLESNAEDLTEDIDRSELAVLTVRAKLLEKASTRLPDGFAEDWAAARTAIEMLRTAQAPGETNAVPLDVQEFVRGTVLAFYWSLRGWEVKRYREAVAASHNSMMVWKMTQMPVAGTRWADRRPPPAALAPKPPTFDVRKRRVAVELAQTPAEWAAVRQDFERCTVLVDQWVKEMVARNSPERQALELAVGLHDRQVDLQKRQPVNLKIPAVFYPKDETQTDGGKERAVGYPWFFYLYRVGNNPDWILEDVTVGKRVNVHDQTLQEGIESFARSQFHQPPRVDPPVELWEQLNSKLRFPKGELRLKVPSKKMYVLETTAETTWSEYLGYAAMAAGAAALVLATAGAGTPAVIATIGAAGLGVAGSAVGLSELAEQGMATGADRAKAGFMIAVDLVSAITLGLGKVAAGVARAGPLASNTARLAGRFFVPIARLSVALDVTQLAVMTEQFVEQFQAIATQTGLTDEQRADARRKIVLIGLASGAFSWWSIKSTMQDISRGRTVHADELTPGLASSTARGQVLGPPAPVAAPLAASDFRLGKARIQEKPHLVENLAPGTIDIELRRNRVGLISEIVIVHGPMPAGRSAATWAADLAHHQQIARVAQQYSGLIGEIREFLARLGAAITGRQRGPLERQLELVKLENRIEDRLRRLQRADRLTPQEIAGYHQDIRSFANQIEGHRQAIARGDARPGRISQQGTPEGYPVAPPGHSYHYDGITQSWEIRPDQHTTGPQFRVERDQKSGLPTGRFTNRQQIENLKVVGLPIDNPATSERLRALGYNCEGSGSPIIRPVELPGAPPGSMVPLRVVDGKVAISPHVHLDAQSLGPARFYRKFYGSTLNSENMVGMHRGVSNETGWLEVKKAIGRGGDETLLRRGSEYGLMDYVRYHIVGPGTGLERTRIFLAPEVANQFANHEIEGFMRRMIKNSAGGEKVFFKARYSTFSGEELRSFIDGMLTSGDQRILRVLARDGGKFDRILKSVEYDIRVVDAGGVESWYRAAITMGPPGSGNVTKQAPRLVAPVR